MGMLFIPIPFLSIGLRVGESSIAFVMRKQGSTVYEERIRSYGEISALLDMGLVQLPVEEILFEAFYERLPEWGFSAEETAYLRQEQASLSPEAFSQRIQEIFGRILEIENRQSLLIDYQEPEEARHTKTVHIQRLNNWIAKSGQTLPQIRPHTRRRPSSNETPATILFLADGLRPDRLHEAAQQGLVPTIQEHFLKKGAEMNAHTSRSLTLPSWATILTGMEPDEHGIRSNSPASRQKRASSENFIDPRKDLFLKKYIEKGRTYRRLEEAGVTWLPRYFEKQEVALNFMPINDGKYPPIGRLLGKLFTNFDELWGGTFSGSEQLDTASYESIAADIRAHPGKHKLIVIWFASIDSHSHYSSHKLNWAYEILDKGVAKILEAAEQDPVLKNARTVLISDHGHLGGPEAAHSDFCAQEKPIFINNTGFNLTKFFAGDFVDARDLSFVVGSAESPEPKYDINYLSEFMIQPFAYTYRGNKKTKGNRNLLVDYSGDNLAQVYVLDNKGKASQSPLNYHELSQYQQNKNSQKTNLLQKLLKFQIRNLESIDLALQKCLREKTGMRPVEFITLSLGKASLASIRKILPAELHRPWDRPPVLIESLQGKGLILSHRNTSGEDIFQYFSLKSFQQNSDHSLSFEIDTRGTVDPLQIISKSVDYQRASQGLSDRQWLNHNLAHKHLRPTAPYTFARAATLSPRLQNSHNRVDENPDMILYAQRGFSFHSGHSHQSDHGGVHAIETRVSLYISGLGQETWTQAVQSSTPLLTRDLVPTLLDQHGLWDEKIGLQGQSFESYLKSLRR
jgi:hypothetical protein